MTTAIRPQTPTPGSEGQPLGHLRVLDLSDKKGAYCTKLFADLGATVTKVEPPDGDSMRRQPPFKGGSPGAGRSLHFAYYHANKRGVTLDLTRDESRPILRRLFATHDVVVSSFTPAVGDPLGVDEPTILGENPQAVFCSLTPFGRTGPYRNFRGTNFTLDALGGQMISHGEVEGPPITMPGRQIYDLAGVHAAFATMVALANRGEVGGQMVDISIQESQASQGAMVMRYSLAAINPPREAGKSAFPPGGTWHCKNGEVDIQVLSEAHWRGFLELVGNPPQFSAPEWATVFHRGQHREELEAWLTDWMAEQDNQWVADRAQALHVPACAQNTLKGFFEDDQARSRGFFVRIEDPVLGRAEVAGAPYLLSEPLWRLRSAAPTLGQHNDEVYRGELGFTAEDIQRWKREGIV